MKITLAKRPILFIFELIIACIWVACEACNALKTDFVVTARCENFLYGRPDLGNTIRRFQASEVVSSDVLYAPELCYNDRIKTVCRNVIKPVNVVMAMLQPTFDLVQFA